MSIDHENNHTIISQLENGTQIQKPSIHNLDEFQLEPIPTSDKHQKNNNELEPESHFKITKEGFKHEERYWNNSTSSPKNVI